jgi:hypothetical protein
MDLIRKGAPELPPAKNLPKVKAPRIKQNVRTKGWKSNTTYLLAFVIVLAVLGLSAYTILKRDAPWGAIVMASTVICFICDRAVSYIFGPGGRQSPLLSVLTGLLLERARCHSTVVAHLVEQGENVDTER